MDDLIGTQAPQLRLTEAIEAVAYLERAVPGLAAHRLPTSANVDWSVVETELGTAVPADFKLLCSLYPTLDLGDFIRVVAPIPGQEEAWVQGVRDDLEIVAEWCEEGDLAVPVYPYPSPGGLFPWATSLQGDLFLWTTSPTGPGDWAVTVASRNGGWWHYTGGMVQFLADLVTEAVELWGLPSVRAEVTWSFDRDAESR
ncbi:SMI1/KNR4 family protein [Streptomyces sp. NPDC053493]|uniref:SMI1/KNR4 family protein n=1 Tax=Streptomyces sp. NPDC053493 TaxID=3365705 RepID=UPI0037D90B42